MYRSCVAIVLVTLLSAGCLGGTMPASEDTPEDVATTEADLRAITASFSGTVTATPATPDVQEFFFDVPTGAVGVNATLAWQTPVARFGFELIDPYGELTARGYAERQGRLVVATVEPPKSGEWTLRVIGQLAIDEAFTIEAAAELLVPKDNLVRQSTQMRPGGYNEVNVIMEAGATFAFSFTSSDDVDWDVHSHPDNRVKYWEQGTGTSAESSFTAPERGIYSLMFHNPNALPVDLTFEMTGEFRLHSHAQ